MKKMTLVFLVTIGAFSTHAQNKISWENIQGKWQGFAFELKGIVYYDWEKDSLAVSDSVKNVLKKKGLNDAAITAAFKQQFEDLSDLSVQFNRDSTAQFFEDEDEPELTRYTVDEKTSVIHSVNKMGVDQFIKAEILGDKLRLQMGATDGFDEIWIILKKMKP